MDATTYYRRKGRRRWCLLGKSKWEVSEGKRKWFRWFKCDYREMRAVVEGGGKGVFFRFLIIVNVIIIRKRRKGSGEN